MLEQLKNISFSARNYFLKLITCCPVGFVKKISWYLFCKNEKDNNFFLPFNIFIIQLTHSGVQIRSFIADFALNLPVKIIFLKFYTNVKKMFAIAQPNFTKQSCHTTIFHDPLITYCVWKIADLIPQCSSSAGQLQM